jgi:uncharacterized protein (TIGR01777 family)
MRILITGGVGFVGRHLSKFLLRHGHEVCAIGFRATQEVIDQPHFRYLSADTSLPGQWQQEVRSSDAVINLTGRTIFKRWTPAYKRQIYNSRVLTTRNIVDALPHDRALSLISTSAIGYYGARQESIITEETPAGDDFLAEVAVDWEAEAQRAEAAGHRVVIGRLSVVLGPDGGAIEKMLPAFRSYIGGPIGDGNQWFSWIHIEDLINALHFALTHETLQGAFNLCAPKPVRNREMARTMGRILRKPAFMPAPAFTLKLVLGEFATTLLASQRVHPQRLLDAGFSFSFGDIETALGDLLQ